MGAPRRLLVKHPHRRVASARVVRPQLDAEPMRRARWPSRFPLGAYVLHRARCVVEPRHESTEKYVHLSFLFCAIAQDARDSRRGRCVRGNICVSWVTPGLLMLRGTEGQTGACARAPEGGRCVVSVESGRAVSRHRMRNGHSRELAGIG